ncbi:MAG TPA: ATP-binding protein [Pyrinomonadaceae bacterium]|nr:ATP-binding protein [Pyrinomonadaceae bacterium]
MSEETPKPLGDGERDDEVRADEARAARRRSGAWLLGGLVLILLAVLVVLQVFGLWEIFTPDTASDTLLIYALSSLNFVAFFVFTFIFIRNLLKLRRERRERQLGSNIKTRLVVYFIAVSLLPITAMAVFSFLFFNRTIEKWFGRIPEDVVREAREARDEDAAQRARQLLEAARLAALTLEPSVTPGQPDASRPTGAAADAEPPVAEAEARKLEALLEGGGFAAVALDTREGSEGTRFGAGADFKRTKDLDAAIDVARVRRRAGAITSATLVETSEGLNVAAVPLADGRAFYAVADGGADARLEKIVSGAESFEELRRRQRKVRMLGLSTIGLMTLILLFVATWSAIHLARGIGAPVRALAEASKRVAGGDLDTRVTTIADDELAVLAASFNEMTAQLAENRRRIEVSSAELRDKNIALEERRDYIETVLESLSTGVVSLDEENRVTTINAAALQMLRLAEAPAPGAFLIQAVSEEDYAALGRVLWRARLRGRATEQTELGRGASAIANGGNGGADGGGTAIPVALTATALGQGAPGVRRGVVLVMEDLTDLLAAQRAAAWSEVARRMAHEIKNPLTPIQLSAERIARNFRRLSADNGGANGTERERVARVVEECTATITREVAGLKGMVDEFTRFARLPHAKTVSGDLNEVISQALALYEDRLDGVRVDVLLAPSLPPAMLDPEQMRRVFVNLIDNAAEALADEEGERRITVATAHDPARGLLLAEVADNGHGIAREDFPRLFQPYFSTRGRGTGLGLAIVQRILGEHGGRIRAEHNHPRGARLTIELPVAEETRA